MKDGLLSDKKEKKERTGWQKFVRGFWITVSVICAVIVFGFIALVGSTNEPDHVDLSDNQKYVITVTYEATTYNYYCTSYTRNIINNSYVLLDHKGKPFAEIMMSQNLFMRVTENPNYKPEYFEKKKEEEKEELPAKAV